MTCRPKWYSCNDHTSNNRGVANCKNDAMKTYDFIWELKDLNLYPITPKKWNLVSFVVCLSRFQDGKTA